MAYGSQPMIDELGLNDFLIDYKERTEWEMLRNDFHEHYEIFFSLSDGVQCFVDGVLYEVRRGDVFFFPPHVLHRTVALKGAVYKRYVIRFRRRWITDFIPAAESLELFRSPMGLTKLVAHLGEAGIRELTDQIERMKRIESQETYQVEMRMKLGFTQMLLFLCSLFQTAEPMAMPCVSGKYRWVEDLTQYIKDHLASELSLDKLALTFFTGKSQLCRLFKRYTGYTINEYVIEMRILRAKELLVENLSVMQVCEMTGFGNYTHFIRTFAKLVGVSPKQYALKQ